MKFMEHLFKRVSELALLENPNQRDFDALEHVTVAKHD